MLSLAILVNKLNSDKEAIVVIMLKFKWSLLLLLVTSSPNLEHVMMIIANQNHPVLGHIGDWMIFDRALLVAVVRSESKTRRR